MKFNAGSSHRPLLRLSEIFLQADIVLIAKPLAAGLPLGAILTTEDVASRVSAGMHGTTFGGGPLACPPRLEFLHIVEDENLLENILSRGLRTAPKVSPKLATKFDFIRAVRGEGLMIGIELSVEGGPICQRGHAARFADQLHPRFYAAPFAALPYHPARKSANFSSSWNSFSQPLHGRPRPRIPPNSADPQARRSRDSKVK